jgi:hypothetical protein
MKEPVLEMPFAMVRMGEAVFAEVERRRMSIFSEEVVEGEEDQVIVKAEPAGRSWPFEGARIVLVPGLERLRLFWAVVLEGRRDKVRVTKVRRLRCIVVGV